MIPGILLLTNLLSWHNCSWTEDWLFDCELQHWCEKYVFSGGKKSFQLYWARSVLCKTLPITQLSYERNVIEVSLNLTLILIAYNRTSSKLWNWKNLFKTDKNNKIVLSTVLEKENPEFSVLATENIIILEGDQKLCL